MAKLRTLAPRVRTLDTRTAKPPPNPLTEIRRRLQPSDPFYHSKEFLAWRSKVIARAKGRCEATDHGFRCTKAQPRDRMFADHVVARADGGEPFDLANGQCLCGSHHVRKTHAEKRKRLGG